MRRCRGLKCTADDLMDSVKVFGNGLRRKHFSSLYEAIVVEDGAVADMGCKSFRNSHVSRLDVRRECKWPLLNGDTAQQLDIADRVHCFGKSIERSSAEPRIHALNLIDKVLFDRFASLWHHPVQIAKTNAFGECKLHCIIDDVQSF